MTLGTMLVFQGVCSLHAQKLFLAGDVPTNGCFGKEDKSKKDNIFVWGIQSSNFGGCQATESSNKNCFLLMVNLIVLEVDHHGKKDVNLQRW